MIDAQEVCVQEESIAKGITSHYEALKKDEEGGEKVETGRVRLSAFAESSFMAVLTGAEGRLL